MSIVSTLWNFCRNTGKGGRFAYEVFVEALFPRDQAEETVSSLTPEQALLELPRAPAPPLEYSSSVFAYKDKRVTKLVWNIKYKKSEQSLKIAGLALYKALIELGAADTGVNAPPIIVIPMPITPRRLRERGFNQCDLIVDEIAKLDNEKRLSIVKDVLIRSHHDSRQTLKTREERLVSAKGIFSINGNLPTELGKSALIVIIDDVLTTGSTMKEAMDTIKKSGLTNVRGLSLAH